MRDGDTRSISGLGGSGPGKSASADAEVAVGERIGRYLILSRLRAGGMGVVYAAYDPDLDRQVAIKLLLREVSGSRDDQCLLRAEGRALARLQHGNVVSIYDVGEHDGRVFIAMELVEGRTLSEWLAGGERSWREIVDVFVKAGWGLAAAHEVGLLHGDFKPSNVMVTEEGSVRVTDFGLARFLDGVGSAPSSGRGQSGHPKGTPGFIAPEILAGGAGDARSDLFSFCVALSQILFGTKDGSGTVRSLRPNAAPFGVRGRPPRWVRRVLERGLAEDPDERYPTMEELLRDLRPGRRRRRRLVGAAVGLVILQGALWVPTWSRWASTEDSCEARSRFPEEVWSRDRAAMVEDRFVSMAPDQGRHMSGLVADALDEYAEDWAAVRVDVCESFEEKLESPKLFDLRMDCLDERLSEIRAVVGVLLTADRWAVDHAGDLVFGVRGLGRCRDRDELLNLDLPPLDPSKAGEVERLREEIENAFLEIRMVDPVDLETGEELLERARQLGQPLLEARALELVARQLWVQGDLEEAARWTIEALTAALAVGDRPLQALMYSALAQIESNKGAGFAQAEVWERLADSALRPLGDAHDEVRFDVERGLSLVDFEKGDLPGAHARLRRALALGEKTWGPDSARLRVPLSDLAAELGEGEEGIVEGIRLLERSLEIGVATLGPESPLLLPARVNLSHRLRLRGELEEAERLARAAVRTAAASSSYSWAPFPYQQLGEVLVARDRPEEALDLLDTALRLASESFGDAHRVPIEIRTARGFAELRQLELSKARETFESALALTEQLPGGHWSGHLARLGLGYVELASGREEVALGLFVRLAADTASGEFALAAWAKVMLYGGQGESLLRLGRSEEARRHLERAIEEEPAAGDPLLLARPRFALARLLVEERREVAVGLAARARDGLSDARSPESLRLRSELDAWLLAHGTDRARRSSPGRDGAFPSGRRGEA